MIVIESEKPCWEIAIKYVCMYVCMCSVKTSSDQNVLVTLFVNCNDGISMGILCQNLVNNEKGIGR